MFLVMAGPLRALFSYALDTSNTHASQIVLIPFVSAFLIYRSRKNIFQVVGYAVIPGKNGEHAGSFVKCISADSKNTDLAYLFAQWQTSPSVSLQRVMLPYTLRDPYRLSHYRSKTYRGLWPSAKEYLIGLNNGANNAVIDAILRLTGNT